MYLGHQGKKRGNPCVTQASHDSLFMARTCVNRVPKGCVRGRVNGPMLRNWRVPNLIAAAHTSPPWVTYGWSTDHTPAWRQLVPTSESFAKVYPTVRTVFFQSSCTRGGGYLGGSRRS